MLISPKQTGMTICVKLNVFYKRGQMDLQLNIKVKWSRYRPGVAQRVGRVIALLFHYRGTRRGWVVSSTPRPHFTPGKDPVPHCIGGWVGPRASAENLVPNGIRSRIVQPLVSRYTDSATRPTQVNISIPNKRINIALQDTTWLKKL